MSDYSAWDDNDLWEELKERAQDAAKRARSDSLREQFKAIVISCEKQIGYTREQLIEVLEANQF